MDVLQEGDPIKITCKKKNLTGAERREIYEALLRQSNNGKLKRGAMITVASSFSVSTRSVRQIWKQAKVDLANGSMVDFSPKLLGRVGCKRVQFDLNQVSTIPLRRRTNIRSMLNALNIARSTLHRRIKEGFIRPHSNAIKPYLTEGNKIARLQFCLSMIEPGTINSNPIFSKFFNYVHIDEKWFYLSKTAERYYLLPNEDDPLRTCKSKRFMPKIMFLAAVARPRFDISRNQEFTGKIGIFPFTYQEPAKLNSKNRVAGTLETKPILSVTKDVIKLCLIEKVLPAIRSMWPCCSSSPIIFIQQDNARPHIDPNDSDFLEAASRDGFDIRLSFQPPNSPDLNVLDLGFFRAIQSLQYQEAPTTINELVNAVEKSFNELSSVSLEHVFLTLQLCMIEIMKVNGGNNYKLPHIGKRRLEREGNLPHQIECDQDILKNALLHIQQ